MFRIYRRVSSSTQSTDSQSIALDKWRSANDDKEMLVYTETASGKSMDRPVWNKLMEDCQRGNSMLISSLDRLGRNCSGMLAVFDELIARGINLVSLRENVSLDSPTSRLLLNIMASFASFERELILERQRNGIAAARSKGKRWGGSKSGRQLLNKDKLSAIGKLNGLPISEVARLLKISRQSVRKYRQIAS